MRSKTKTKSGLVTGSLVTGSLVTNGLSSGAARVAAQTAAAELAAKTARGVRLVGETGDGRFRVSLSPVKKRKPKDKPEPLPITRWSSSAYPWDGDAAQSLTIPGIDIPRRIVAVAVTVTGDGLALQDTELALRVTPGAGDADSVYAATRWSGGSGGLSTRVVYQLWPTFSDPAGGYDVARGVIPPDLWLMPADVLVLEWTAPPALDNSEIHGVVIRWENAV